MDYVVRGVRRGQIVEFRRQTEAAAFATARRLLTFGWLVAVLDPEFES